MGHERIGFLPKTQSWNHIVDQLGQFDSSDAMIKQIANQTLANIRKTYSAMPNDESVIKAIQYLALLTFSAKKSEQIKFLNDAGISIDGDISLFALVRNAKRFITTENGSLESNKIACDAILETITTFERNNKDGQLSLFSDQSPNIWASVGSGAAFCELTRGFFASFTDRYLRYYLERAAAHSINDFQKLEVFSNKLSEQTQKVSHHAFETAKIMQSFAAGWFNNHAINDIPTKDEVTGFLKISFEKMREEFRREAEKS
jgi:hypothetical protein